MHVHRDGLILNKERARKKSGLHRTEKRGRTVSRPVDVVKHSNGSDGEKPLEDKDIYRFRQKDCIFSSPFCARIIREVIISRRFHGHRILYTNLLALLLDYILELLFDTMKFMTPWSVSLWQNRRLGFVVGMEHWDRIFLGN